MIRLTSDSSIADEYLTALTRTAGNRGKLFRATYDADEAQRCCAELRERGYEASVKTNSNIHSVYYWTAGTKVKVNDNVLNKFEKVEDNLYRSLTAGVYDYEFDDGAIWRVVKYDDGEYLVKEVADDDEEQVIRQKKASSTTTSDVRPAVTAMYGEVPSKLLDVINSNGVLRSEFTKILANGGATLEQE